MLIGLLLSEITTEVGGGLDGGEKKCVSVVIVHESVAIALAYSVRGHGLDFQY